MPRMMMPEAGRYNHEIVTNLPKGLIFILLNKRLSVVVPLDLVSFVSFWVSSYFHSSYGEATSG